MSAFFSFRFLLSMIFNATDYNVEIIKLQNRKFFNNSEKIVGWSRGYPSISLYAPPFFSKPSANSLITRVMSLYQWRKLPELLSVAVTPDCNCDCDYCSFTSMRKEKQPLSTEQIIDSISQAQELGVSTISIVGGEPTMNRDILKIISSINKDLSQVIMFTNGYYLKEMARDLKKAGLTSIIVSIDSADAETHNKMKGKKGLFEKALEGIKEAKKRGLLVGTSTVAHKDDIKNGNLERIFELGKKRKVNEQIIYDSLPTGNYKNKLELAWSKTEKEELIRFCSEHNKKKHYPNIFPYAYFKSSRSIGCAGGSIYFYLSPYGDVCPCDFNSASIGNVQDKPLSDLWDAFSTAKEFCTPSAGGCKLINSIPKN